MNLYAAAATHAVVAALAFGSAWQMQAATIAQMELESAHEVIQSQLDARDDAEARVATVQAAQTRAAVRVRAVSAERSSADAVGNGLRLTTAETVRAAGEDPAACTDHAATLGVVFDQCVQAYIGVAEAADRWASEAVMQHEAAQ